MWYINAQPTVNGNYGAPQSNPTDSTIALPDALLSAYLDTMGFATLTVDGGHVTTVTVNQATLDSYTTSHSDSPEPEPLPTPTALDRLEAQVLYTAMMTDTLLEG